MKNTRGNSAYELVQWHRRFRRQGWLGRMKATFSNSGVAFGGSRLEEYNVD